jgi:hypothetical protein
MFTPYASNNSTQYRSAAIKEHRRRATCGERLGECQKRRESDAAGDHPSCRGWVDGFKWAPERSKAVDARSRLELEEQRRSKAGAFVEDRNPGGPAVTIAQDFEDRERPAQQRIQTARRLDHDELSGTRVRGNARGVERQHVVLR